MPIRIMAEQAGNVTRWAKRKKAHAPASKPARFELRSILRYRLVRGKKWKRSWLFIATYPSIHPTSIYCIHDYGKRETTKDTCGLVPEGSLQADESDEEAAMTWADRGWR